MASGVWYAFTKEHGFISRASMRRELVKKYNGHDTMKIGTGAYETIGTVDGKEISIYLYDSREKAQADGWTA